MGGGGNPAGWASNISIDQGIEEFSPGSFGDLQIFSWLAWNMAVPNRAPIP